MKTAILFLTLLSTIAYGQNIIIPNPDYRLLTKAQLDNPTGLQTIFLQKGYVNLLFESTDTATYQYVVDVKRTKKIWSTTQPPVTQSVTMQATAFKSKTSGSVVGTLFVPVPGTKAVYAVPPGARNRIAFTYALADAPMIHIKVIRNGVVIYDGNQSGKELAQTGGWGTGNLKTTLPLTLSQSIDGGEITIETDRGFDWSAFTLSKQ